MNRFTLALVFATVALAATNASSCTENCETLCANIEENAPGCISNCMTQFCGVEATATSPASTEETKRMTMEEALQMVNDFQREDMVTPSKKTEPAYFWIFVLELGCIAIVGTGVYVAWMYLTKKSWFKPYKADSYYHQEGSFKLI
jgi:hypothetical protein